MTDTTTADQPIGNQRVAAKARTAARVLEAARIRFAADGYEAASIRDIAKAAGMSTGAIFANYDDKAALYAAVVGHPPVSAEVGARAMIILRALNCEMGREFGTEMVDEVAAIDRCRVAALDLIHDAGFPPLPDEQILDPDEHSLVEVMEAALGEQR